MSARKLEEPWAPRLEKYHVARVCSWWPASHLGQTPFYHYDEDEEERDCNFEEPPVRRHGGHLRCSSLALVTWRGTTVTQFASRRAMITVVTVYFAVYLFSPTQ